MIFQVPWKLHPSKKNPAGQPLSTTPPPAPHFSTSLLLIHLLSTILLRALSETSLHVNKRASCIISVGFTVHGVHGPVSPANRPASTSPQDSHSSRADDGSSSTTCSATSSANSTAAATVHSHPRPSLRLLGFCCTGTEGKAGANASCSSLSLRAQPPEHLHSIHPLRISIYHRIS